MKKIKSIVFLIVLTSCINVRAQEGSTIAQFLKIPVDARIAGMGEAAAAVSSDAAAMFWNPAGLVRAQNFSLMFNHTFWFADIAHDYLAVSIPLNENNVLGVSITSLNVGDIEITTLEQPNGTGRFFSASDFALGLTFSRKMTDRLTVGVTARYIRQQIVNEVATGLGFDVGTTLDIGEGGLRLGMSLTNFGAGLKMEGEDLVIPYYAGPANTPIKAFLETLEWPLPTNFRIGLMFQAIGPESMLLNSENSKLIIAVDGNHPVDALERVNFGAEYSFNNVFFLRAGYKYRYYKQGMTYGGGVRVPMGETDIVFDYALSDYGLLDFVHRVTVQFQFQ